MLHLTEADARARDHEQDEEIDNVKTAGDLAVTCSATSAYSGTSGVGRGA
jgi:hypothetical protein